MSDEVKFIFMTLIKVPVIIFIAFFIFNLFAFFFIYFKMLGLSYVAMQETVENNFIPKNLAIQFNNVFESIDDIPMASDTTLICGQTDDADPELILWAKNSQGNPVYVYSNGEVANLTDFDTSVAKSALERTQYGQQRLIGVHCRYTFVWPLSHASLVSDTGVHGYDGEIRGMDGVSNGTPLTTTYNSANDPYAGDTPEGDNANDVTGGRYAHGHASGVPINIYYTVPGLKYYADTQ